MFIVNATDCNAGQLLRALLEQHPLRTDRLVLRLPRVADAALMFRGYARDVEALRWLGFPPHGSVDTCEDVVVGWIANWNKGEGSLGLIIESALDEAFLGVINMDPGAHGIIIGYVLERTAWGRGIATEAVRCVVDVAFEHFGAWRVWATCAPQNPASRRVLEKAGMRHEGVLRRWIVSPLVSPEPRDSDCLAITRDDWLGARKRDTVPNGTT